MLALDWIVKLTPDHDILLGDAGVNFVSGDISDGARVPLSCDHALFMLPSTRGSKGIRFEKVQSHEIFNLNAESAARAKRWLIGATESVVAHWKPQVRPV